MKRAESPRLLAAGFLGVSVAPGRARASGREIFVKYYVDRKTQATLTLDVDSSDTIEAAKQKIQDKRTATHP